MLKELIKRYPSLSLCEAEIEKTAQAIISCYKAGGKILTCGNEGSCADADHIVGELMKDFLKERPLPDEKKRSMLEQYPQLDTEVLCKLQGGLPALSLCTLTALNTAFCNDVDPDLVYAQAVLGMGKAGDLLICISTSGNAKNVLIAAQTAKALGLTVIGLTGLVGGKLSCVADICISVPETETFKVQELHLPVYHYLCAAAEAHIYS